MKRLSITISYLCICLSLSASALQEEPKDSTVTDNDSIIISPISKSGGNTTEGCDQPAEGEWGDTPDHPSSITSPTLEDSQPYVPTPFSIKGMRIATMQSGIVIIRERLSNGEIRTRKILVSPRRGLNTK